MLFLIRRPLGVFVKKVNAFLCSARTHRSSRCTRFTVLLEMFSSIRPRTDFQSCSVYGVRLVRAGELLAGLRLRRNLPHVCAGPPLLGILEPLFPPPSARGGSSHGHNHLTASYGSGSRAALRLGVSFWAGFCAAHLQFMDNIICKFH